MTTNNHPAHGPVSLDRLHQIREILSKAAAQSDGGNLGYAMADAVKVIDVAIAAFGAEPVPFDALRDAVAEVSGGPVMEWSDIYKGHQAVPFINFNSLARIVDKFRTSQPAPVVPTFDEWLEICGNKPLGWVKDAMRESYDACRAAMLQAGTLTNEDNKPAWTGIPDIDNAINMLDRIDTLESCDDDRIEAVKTVLRRLAGNSPVTQDGWQLVPKEPTEAMNKAGWAAMNEHDAINQTYRAMLEAAPQQEVKNV
ncbi:hypothetical protein ACNPG5_06360 [Citrobacter cronae]|uniref:hypothetical protein n=1 Tax=Citrobacter cronae TaxID=1748967 RepID=UPI003AA7AC69